MKTLAPLFIVACFTVAVVSPAPVQGRPNQMAGQDYATKGYNAAARQKGRSCSTASAMCVKNNGNTPEVVARCQSARAACLRSGTFVGLQGRVFPGLAKM